MQFRTRRKNNSQCKRKRSYSKKRFGGAAKVVPADAVNARDFYTMSMDKLKYLVQINYDFQYIPQTSAKMTALMTSIFNKEGGESFSLYLINNIKNPADILDFTHRNVDNYNVLDMAILMNYQDLAMRIIELSNTEQKLQLIQPKTDSEKGALILAKENNMTNLVNMIESIQTTGGSKQSKRQTLRRNKRIKKRKISNKSKKK